MSFSILRRLRFGARSSARPRSPYTKHNTHTGKEAEISIEIPLLTPEEPLCLVGDLHGRLDLLERLLLLRANHFPDTRLVVLGDLLDRGPDSAGVLRRLKAEQECGAVCISGNHEAMILAFLDDPLIEGREWLSHGGLETLASFGVSGLPRSDEELVAVRDRLRTALSASVNTSYEDWIRTLPLWWQSGNLIAVHAGMDPASPANEQLQRVLQWGHREFGRIPRTDGLWVAHGHVIVDHAFSRNGCISLDTGAYATGRLSYALIDPTQPPQERLVLAVTP